MKSLSSTNTAALLDSLGGPTKISKAEEPKSNHYTPGVTSGIEEKALSLLGSGIAAESVASALGVTPARIAQLLSSEIFADQVASLRYENLQEHNKRDAQYDRLEDVLLNKLENSIPLMFKPAEILNAVAVVNKANRRGQASPSQVTNQQNIVTLVLPKIIAENFSVDINNQVTRAGDQELHTMPSGNLLKKVEESRETAEALLIEQEPCVDQKELP